MCCSRPLEELFECQLVGIEVVVSRAGPVQGLEGVLELEVGSLFLDLINQAEEEGGAPGRLRDLVNEAHEQVIVVHGSLLGDEIAEGELIRVGWWGALFAAEGVKPGELSRKLGEGSNRFYF